MGDAELGARLRKAREDGNYTQAAACDKLGIPKTQTLSAYETGKNNPPIEILKKMSETYKITTDELLFGEKKSFNASDSSNCENYYRKKDKEYFLDLVRATDALNLPLIPMDGSELPSYGINLSSFYANDKVQFFVHSWKKYKELLAQNIIDEFEYSALLQRKVEDLDDYYFLPF